MVGEDTIQLADRRRAPTQLVGLLALAVTVAVFLWQLPHFLAGNSTIWPQYASAFTDMLFYTAWGFAVLLALTAFTRTVPLRLLVAFWFLGVFAVHGLVVAVERSFIDMLGVSEMGIWVAPVVETLAVLLVVVAFYALATYRSGTHPTVSDGLLVGFATGAGLGFHEEMTYARLVPIGPGAEYASVGRMGQDIWWSYVFPLIGWQGQFNIRQFGNGVTGHFTLYHAGWATLVGVGVGAVFVHRHRILAWIAGLTAVVVTYLDHMSGNFIVGRPLETPPIVGDLFQAGDATGVSELAVYILLVAIASAITVDLLVLRRTAEWIDDLRPVRSVLRDHRSTSESNSSDPSSLHGLSRAVGLEAYARNRRATMIGLYRHASSGGNTSGISAALSHLYASGRSVGVVASVVVLVASVLAGLLALIVNGVATNAEVLACAGCASPSRFIGIVPTSIGSLTAAAMAILFVNTTYNFAQVSGSRTGQQAEYDSEGTVIFSKLSREEQARIRELATTHIANESRMGELSKRDRALVENYWSSGRGFDMMRAISEPFNSLITSAVETVQSMASDFISLVSWKRSDKKPKVDVKKNVAQGVLDYVSRVTNKFIETGKRLTEGKFSYEPTDKKNTEDEDKERK